MLEIDRPARRRISRTCAVAGAIPNASAAEARPLPHGVTLGTALVTGSGVPAAKAPPAAAPRDVAAGEAGDADDGDLDWLLAEPQEGEPARPTRRLRATP